MVVSISQESFRGYLDYVPVISTITNIQNLYYKCITDTTEEGVINNRYYTYLNDKSSARYVVLLIPIIGNLIVAIYDFVNYLFSNTATVLALVQQNGLALQHASPDMQNNETIVLAAATQNGCALQFASPAMRNNEAIVLAAATQNGRALQFASPAMRNNEAIVLAAATQNGFALQFASPAMRNNEAIVRAAVRQNGFALQFASPAMQNNPELQELARR